MIRPGDVEARRPIRVVRICTRLNVGGPSFQIRSLHRFSDPDRVHQTLIYGSVPAGETEADFTAEFDGIRIPDLVRNISPRRDLRARATLSRLIGDIRPDVVHTHQSKAGLLGRLAALRARVPVIIHTFHGHTFHGYWPRPVASGVQWVERRLAARSTAIVVQSESIRDELSARLSLPVERIHVIRPGVDFERLERSAGDLDDWRRELGLEDAFVVALVGRLAPVKNVDAFLRVVHRLTRRTSRRVVALVAGSGEPRLEARLHAMEARLGLRGVIRWLGTCPNVATIYDLAGAVALTSKNEGTPLVLIEAVSRGTPCVAFDVGGVAETVAGLRSVTVVPAGDEEAMAEHLLQIAQAGTMRDSVRYLDDAATVRNRFGAKRLAHETMELYERLLAVSDAR